MKDLVPIPEPEHVWAGPRGGIYSTGSLELRSIVLLPL